MKFHMKEWIKNYICSTEKKPMPILSFPGIQLTGYSVKELVNDGHIQALCMKAIAEKFAAGAVFSAMDLSVEAEAFGSPVLYNDTEVPTIKAAVIHDIEEVKSMKVPELGAGRTNHYIQGVKEASELITDRPVFSGIIGPFSLAGRLLDMTEIMVMCYTEPEMVTMVLEKATEFLCSYAAALKKAGANGIAIAEPAAGLLSPALMKKFSIPYVKEICESVADDNFTVLYHNCGSIDSLLGEIRELSVGIYSVGNTADMEKVLKSLPESSLIIGNIDPVRIFRNGTPNQVYKETLKLLEKYGRHSNFVISSGCDIPPMTPIENIQAFFDAAGQYYTQGGAGL